MLDYNLICVLYNYLAIPNLRQYILFQVFYSGFPVVSISIAGYIEVVENTLQHRFELIINEGNCILNIAVTRMNPIEEKGRSVYNSHAKRNNEVTRALISLYAGSCAKCFHLLYTLGICEGWRV